MKAVAVEQKENMTVVLLKNGTFQTVEGIYPIGQEMEYPVKASGGKGNADGFRRLRPWIAAAATVVILITSGGYYVGYARPVAYVSLDVNPSVEYTVGPKETVLSMTALNDDAQQIVEKMQSEGVRGMTIHDAVDKTLEVLQSQEYIGDGGNDEEDYVLVGVCSDDDAAKQKIEKNLADVLEEVPQDTGRIVNYYMSDTTKRDRKAARDVGISHGRYDMYKKDGKPKGPEKYGKKSVKELIDGKEGAVKRKPPRKKPKTEGKQPKDKQPDKKPPKSDVEKSS